MQLHTCYIPTQHRVSASCLTHLVSRMRDNKKQNPEKTISPTFENTVHRSKMATSIRAKVPNQLNMTTNPRGGSLSLEPRSSQTELFKPKLVTPVSSIQLGRWTSASEVSHALDSMYCRVSRSQKRSCSVVIGKGDML